MKIQFAIISFAIIGIACHSPHSNQDTKLVKVRIDSSINKEYLDWNSLKINGTIPLISSYSDLVNKLGKPDSTSKPDSDEISNSFYNKKFKYCYIKGLQFEKYNDTLVLRNIDFRKSNGLYINSNRAKISNETTIDDFKKLFPDAAENNQLSGTDLDEYLSISLSASRKHLNERWIFTFRWKDHRLIKLEYLIDI
ncbi:MAG TPA: hypothetical protein VFE54_13985 [Mucilaginibacter sp.]|jgi:hypothetical protein|nr:hypothetical protein [Mucilaginibacter sp.]